MKYPKNRVGPSSAGAAAVRDLQTAGVPWTTRRGIDYVARTKDGAPEVWVEGGPQFASSGRVMRDGTEESIVAVSPDYRRSFYRYPYTPGTYVGAFRGIALPNGSVIDTDTSDIGIYSRPGGPGEYTWYLRRYLTDVVGVTPWSPLKTPTVSLESSNTVPMTDYGNIFIVRPPYLPMAINGREVTMSYFFTRFDGSVDLGNIEFPQPWFGVFDLASGEGGIYSLLPHLQGALPSPGIVRRWVPPVSAVVARNTVFSLHVAHWTYTLDAAADTDPRALLLYTDNAGETSWLVADISSLYFVGMPDPPERGTPPLTHYLNQNESPLEKSLMRARLSAQMVPVGGGAALLSYAYLRAVPAAPSTGYSTEWGGRLIRISASGVETVWDSDPDDFSYFQDLAYLGNGRILGKRTYGFDGTGFAVEIVASGDGGAIWETLPAEGLPVLQNQFIGNFTVVRPWVSDEQPGVVLLPAYADGEYACFRSRDGGRTWARTARIAKTEAFYRVDSMRDDGGGNFQNIQFIGTPTRPAEYNPAIPGMLNE